MLEKVVTYHRLHDHGREGRESAWFRVKFKRYAITVCSLPCFAFLFCVGYSLMYNFASSTATVCGAYNILPSISAAIGGYSPQREVWQAAITLSFFPRVIIIRDYVQYYLDVCQTKASLIFILAILNFIENCALMSLSFYDSTSNYSMHKKSFITFVFTSQMYMLLLIYLKSCYILNRSESHGLKLKKLLAAMNICGMILAMYYFIDHNLNCKDFVYTKFALCEYIVVLSNIAYHTTIIYDFPHRNIMFAPKYLVKLEGIGKINRSLVLQA